MGSRDETIEIREGDYVVAMQVAAMPPALPARSSAPVHAIRNTALIAFALGFLATAVIGTVAALI